MGASNMSSQKQAPDTIPTQVIEYIIALRFKYGVASIGIAAIGPEGRSQIFCDGRRTAKGSPLTSESLFPIASNSKLFLAVAIGLLVHRNTPLPNGDNLSWRTKIKDLLGWSLVDKWAEDNLDIVDLLSMRSGFSRNDVLLAKDKTPEDVMQALGECQPSDESRRTFQYNNIHYTLLSLIPKILLGVHYTKFVEENIFAPLNMTSATFDHDVARASGHSVDGFYREGWDRQKMCLEISKNGSKNLYGTEWFGTPVGFENWSVENVPVVDGPGGIIMSLEDTVLWMRELNDPKILPKDMLEQLMRPTTPRASDNPHPLLSHDDYALGQLIGCYRGHKIAHHGGDLQGYASRILRLPDRGFACAIFINDARLGILRSLIANRWMDAVLDLEPFDWEDWETKHAFKPEKHPRLFTESPAPDIQGTYRGRGYPNLRIQQLEEKLFDTNTLCSACNRVGYDLNFGSTVYIAEINTCFVSHVIFTHCKGAQWEWTNICFVPGPTEGQGFLVGRRGIASYVPGGAGEKAGLAMFGGWWGEYESSIKKQEVCEGVKARGVCEVWYEKG